MDVLRKIQEIETQAEQASQRMAGNKPAQVEAQARQIAVMVEYALLQNRCHATWTCGMAKRTVGEDRLLPWGDVEAHGMYRTQVLRWE